MKLWLSGGRLVGSFMGQLTLCDECPCDQQPGCGAIVPGNFLLGSSTAVSNTGGYYHYNPLGLSQGWNGSWVGTTTAQKQVSPTGIMLVWLYAGYTAAPFNSWIPPSGWNEIWTGQLTPSGSGAGAVWWVGWKRPTSTYLPSSNPAELDFLLDSTNPNVAPLVHGISIDCGGDITLWSNNTGTSGTITSTSITVPAHTGGLLIQLPILASLFGSRNINAPSGGLATGGIDMRAIYGGSSQQRPMWYGPPTLTLPSGSSGDITNSISGGGGTDNWRAFQIFIPTSLDD